MPSHEGCWRRIAGVNGFMAIAMGAVAAHAIKDAPLAALAEKASYYQLMHAIVLLWLADCQGKCFVLARRLLLAAIMLFCGSLYVKALTGWVSATAVAPLGGMCFMAAWLVIAQARKMEDPLQ